MEESILFLILIFILRGAKSDEEVSFEDVEVPRMKMKMFLEDRVGILNKETFSCPNENDFENYEDPLYLFELGLCNSDIFTIKDQRNHYKVLVEMFNAATQICKTVDDLVPVPVDILRDVLEPSPKIKTIEKSGAAAQTTAGAFLQTQIVMASNNINILFMQCKNADSKDLNEENVQFLGMFISNTSLMWEIGQVILSLLCGLAAFLGSR